MSSPTPYARRSEWQQRLLPLVTVAPYVLLVILAGVTIVLKWSSRGSLLIDLALCALAAGWMLWMITLHPQWRQRPRTMAVFLAVLIVIMAILVARDSWFGFFAIAGYSYAFRLLAWPGQLAGVAAVAIVAGTAQASSVQKTTALGAIIYIAVLVANVAPMCGLAWLEWNGDKQADEREQSLREISETNRRLEATMAENASLHERLIIQAREAGVIDERRRMAQEIHDTLAQGLTGIITQLHAAEHTTDPAVRQRHFRAATDLAKESLSEARRSVGALRPEPLETARLSDALLGVGQRWSALHGITAQVVTTGAVRPLAPETEVALLRTAQEALANVAKHSHATRTWVTLSYLDGEVALDVRDDGNGFDPERIDDGIGDLDGSGFGLTSMRQRIESLSGTLQIETEPGAGTAISATVPVAALGSLK